MKLIKKMRSANFVWIILSAVLHCACAASEADEMKTQLKQLIISNQKLVEKIETFENFYKIDDINKTFTGLMEKIDEWKTSDVAGHMRSKCRVLCEDQVDTLVNETTTKFQQLEFCVHQKSSNACDPNPCLNGGSCELTSTGSGYNCTKCPFFKSGNNCENLACPGWSACFQLNDVMYVVQEANVTWEEANRKCSSEGMSLALLKDKGTNEWAVDQLRPLYAAKGRIYIWLGLRRSSEGERKWRWTDGSELGEYTGGKKSFKNLVGRVCGALSLNTGSSTWTTGQCNSTYDQYYPLCEKRSLI